MSSYMVGNTRYLSLEIASLYREFIGDIPDAENFAIGTQIGRDNTAADLEFNITSQDDITLP